MPPNGEGRPLARSGPDAKCAPITTASLAMRTLAARAAGRGWHVFPSLPGGKEPAIPSAHPKGDPARGTCTGECGRDGHGFHDATTDPDAIRAWWRPYSARNVAIATGVSNLVVIDLDPPDGRAHFARLGPSLPATFTVSTARPGGLHRYFAAIPGRRSGVRPEKSRRMSTSGRLAATPSRPARSSAAAHTRSPMTASPRRSPTGSLTWPTRQRPLSRRSLRRARLPALGGYAAAALRDEAERLAATTSGRNNRLNRAAFSLGTLIGAGMLSEAAVVQALRDAAQQNGLAAKSGGRRCEATIQSGLSAGMAKPRQVSA